MASTDKNKAPLHNISEWESAADRLPAGVELTKCYLDHGKVTSFNGRARVNGRVVSLVWRGDGECFCKGKRYPDYDIEFNSADR